jgi:hypothetical protein
METYERTDTVRTRSVGRVNAKLQETIIVRVRCNSHLPPIQNTIISHPATVCYQPTLIRLYQSGSLIRGFPVAPQNVDWQESIVFAHYSRCFRTERTFKDVMNKRNGNGKRIKTLRLENSPRNFAWSKWWKWKWRWFNSIQSWLWFKWNEWK